MYILHKYMTRTNCPILLDQIWPQICLGISCPSWPQNLMGQKPHPAMWFSIAMWNYRRLRLTTTSWWFFLPIWKMMEWVTVGIMTFPTQWKNKSHVPNHQSDYICHKEKQHAEFLGQYRWLHIVIEIPSVNIPKCSMVLEYLPRFALKINQM